MHPIISIITNDKKSSILYYEQLYDIFKDNVLLNLHSIEENNLFNLNGDVILVSTFSLLTRIRAIVPDPSKIIVAELSFKKSSLDLIKTIPNKKVLFVNYNAEMTMDAISQIYQAGVTDLELIPYYPGLPLDEEITYAITPGESDIVPSTCKNIIDIGHRVLSLDTIIEVGILLNQEDVMEIETLLEYFKEILNKNLGFETFILDKQRNKTQLNILLNQSNELIMNVNKEGIIQYTNSKTKKAFNLDDKIYKGQHIFKLFKNLDMQKLKEIKTPIHDINLSYDNLNYSTSIFPLQYGNKTIEYLFMFSEKEKLKSKDIGNANSPKAHSSFDDILGNSPTLLNSLKMAKRISLTDFPVCIFGETGTGKGLFAESIHNYSLRKESPFIAVNSGAIPDNLIESELFGYEGGAFTGAKKGGKPGYFELAEDGTLFLDEIDSLNYDVQSKLLKVIENREFRRIGGTKLIKNNARIICSSNKDLLELIEQKKFRDDLYYRINVLSIHIPPLRDRKEDIPIIVNSIIEKNMLGFKISDDAMDMLISHDWKGNIRELQNIIYRLSILEKTYIHSSDLNNVNILVKDDNENIQFKYSIDPNCIKGDIADYYNISILQILKPTFNSSGIGRERIRKYLLDIDIHISDNKLRTILKDLSDKDLITINRGRNGTSITKKGIEYIKSIR